VQEITVRQQSCFAELVERIDAYLDHEEQQEDSRDLKEAPHVNQVPKSRPPEGKRHRRKQSKQCATDQVGVLHLHQEQRCFHSLARDHQERKKKHARNCREARALRRDRVQSLAHVLLDFGTTAPHVNDKRSNHHHRDSAENGFAQSLIGKELADIAADKRSKDVLNHCVVDAFVEHVSKPCAGGEGDGNSDEDGRGQPFLS